MIKKDKDQELLVVSKFFEEADDVEKRYKALRRTIKNIKKFNETQIKTGVAEA